VRATLARPHEEEIFNNMTSNLMLAAAAAPSSGASFFVQTIPLVLIFVIFYFLMIRPQQRRMKEHQAQIAAVKKGDRVVTGGGLIGKVTKVSDSEVEVELGPNMRVQVVKSTLTQVGNPAAAKPAND
jgi:preprotein translocase subunit YajC